MKWAIYYFKEAILILDLEGSYEHRNVPNSFHKGRHLFTSSVATGLPRRTLLHGVFLERLRKPTQTS